MNNLYLAVVVAIEHDATTAADTVVVAVAGVNDYFMCKELVGYWLYFFQLLNLFLFFYF